MCGIIGVEDNRDNKEVIKALLKKVTGIDSLARQEADDDVMYNRRLSLFIERSAIFIAMEMGVAVDLPGEENVDEQDMKTFLKAIYDDRKAT